MVFEVLYWLKAESSKKALFFGSALHEGLEGFWKEDRSLEKALEAFDKTFSEKKSLLSADESYEIPEMEEEGKSLSKPLQRFCREGISER